MILLRGGPSDLEVLLVRRNPESRFMGGAWVFPGGAVNRGEGDGQDALRAAALRELEEEAGVGIDRPELLTPFSRWITPAQAKIRFDTWFYLAAAPDGVTPGSTGARSSTPAGTGPRRRSRTTSRGELTLVFPTIKHLEQLSAVPVRERADRVRRRARGPSDPPRVVMRGETARIVLPGEVEARRID